MVKVTCFGAAKSVTGSNYLVETSRGKSLVVDCGLFQGGKEMEERNREPWSYESRAAIWLDQGKPEIAIPLFNKALALNPTMPDSLSGLGKAYLKQSRPQEALTYLKQAVQLQPDSANFHYQLGQAYLKSGDREEAQKQFDETSRLQAESLQKQTDRLTVKPTTAPEPH